MMSDFERNWGFFMRLLVFIQSILPREWPDSYSLHDGDRFDFIVVGAGSAGGIIASRLSENPEWKVLLVEAGGDPPLASVVPSLFFTLLGTEYDWKYQGKFEEGTGTAHKGGLGAVSRGKFLGGCSSINFEIYSRGVPADYDEWENVAPGWSWNNCLPYFLKSEGMTDPEIFNNPKHENIHSSHGPVLVSRPTKNWYFQRKEEYLLDSFEEIGVKRILEMNGLDPYGATRPHYTFANGRRSSIAEAFLKSNLIKPNLYVAKYTRVTKILVDTENKLAYGVEAILETGRTVEIFANKEVIVSAGAINSPMLLMLSGIGPVEELNKLNIPVLQDLPVGKNMNDHIGIPVILKGREGSNSSLFDYLAQQEFGAHTYPSLGGYFNVLNYSTPQPQIQFFTLHSDANAAIVMDVCENLRFNDETCQSVQEANLHNEIDVIILVLLHPSTSGEVKLTSSNPLDDPIINFGFFKNENDVNTLVEAIKVIRKLEHTTYFKNVGGEVAKLKVTGCEDVEIGSDEYWSCYVRGASMPFLHPTGTCAMGPSGVVNEELKVHGLKGLRVIDASVIPFVPSGNTNAPAMMVGERAADLIKAEYLFI